MSAQADTLAHATCEECGDTFTRTLSTEQAATRAESARLRLRVLALELDGQRASPEGIPPEMLRRLVSLCHPDRHAGSEAANQATAWLLARRNRTETRA